MVFSKSVTFDDEEIGRAVSPASQARSARVEDSLFIDKLRAGDTVAFDYLIERYSSDVYSLLYRLTENAEEARDLTQDTFVRALRSISGFRGDAEVRTWLFRIAINESRNRFRWWKRRRRDKTISLETTIGETNVTVGDTLCDRSISPEDSTLMRERQYAINAALLEMTEIFREAVVLCDVEGLSYEEVAKALGISLGTVKSRLSRGREELRRRLNGY